MKTSKKVLAALLAICLNTGTALAEVDKTNANKSYTACPFG